MTPLSQAELGRWLGVSTRTVREHIASGVIPSAAFAAGDVSGCVRAYCAHLRALASRHREGGGEDLVRERAKLAREQAEAVSLRNGERRGELIRREDVLSTWASHIGVVKSQLRAIPKRLVISVPGFTREMARPTLALIDDALNALAGDAVPRARRRRSR